jgi:hypothetical protein
MSKLVSLHQRCVMRVPCTPLSLELQVHVAKVGAAILSAGKLSFHKALDTCRPCCRARTKPTASQIGTWYGLLPQKSRQVVSSQPVCGQLTGVCSYVPHI